MLAPATSSVLPPQPSDCAPCQTLAASTLHDRVRAAVEQHRDEVERLVADEVDRLVEQLVAERLTASNGESSATLAEVAPAIVEVRPESKRCSRCGSVKPLGEFLRGRAICRPCRSEQHRQYRARQRNGRPEAEPTPAHAAGFPVGGPEHDR